VTALRTALRTPGYSLIVVLTIALAIGANTLLFSIANPLLVRGLPLEDPGRLGWIRTANPERGLERDPASLPDYLDWRAGMRSFQALAAYELGSATLTGHGDARRIQASRATGNLFDVWGLRPGRGRLLQPGDDEPGRELVGVLSYRFWHEAFQGDESALGKVLTIDGRPITIVGVMPQSIEIGNLALIDVWAPLPLDAAAPRDRRTLRVVGRLAPGATIESAHAELQPIVAAQTREHPRTNSGRTAYVMTTTQAMASSDTWVILGLLGVVVLFVLLIGCANLANLVLARLVARQRENAVRVALGASRWQVVRPVLAESLVLSVVGGLLGLALAFGGLRVVTAAATEPFLRSIQIDGNVLAFTVMLSLVTPLLFALWPAVSAGRTVTADMLHGVRSSAGKSTGRRRNVLIGSQVALALALLVVSGLVVQSMLYLRRIDLGFDVPKLLTFAFELTGDRYADGRARSAFVDRLGSRLAALPGAERAAIASHLPALGGDVIRTLSGTRHDGSREQDRPWASWYSVTPRFFDTTGIRVAAGRSLDAADLAGRQPVAVINRMAAEKYFDGVEAAVGRTLTIHDAATGDRAVTVVGVVTDTRDADIVRTSPQIYVPFDQWPIASVTAVLRSEDPGARARDVHALMREVDPTVAVSELRTATRIIDDDLASARIVNGLFVSFAFLALALAAAGLFGVISYSVGQRRREIGIRLALGASPPAIGRMIVREGLVVSGIGMAIGLGLAALLARASTSLLFGISSSDPLTYAGVVALIVVVTIGATAGPASRAMRVDPAKTLRAE
jgi:putative ABC transport system permease protein